MEDAVWCVMGAAWEARGTARVPAPPPAVSMVCVCNGKWTNIMTIYNYKYKPYSPPAPRGTRSYNRTQHRVWGGEGECVLRITVYSIYARMRCHATPLYFTLPYSRTYSNPTQASPSPHGHASPSFHASTRKRARIALVIMRHVSPSSFPNNRYLAAAIAR